MDVDPGDDGPEVTRRPTHIGNDAVRREAQDATTAVEDLLTDVTAEADPMLDPLLMPDQFDTGKAVCLERRSGHDASPRTLPRSRRRPTSEELESNTLDSELGAAEAFDPLDEFDRLGS